MITHPSYTVTSIKLHVCWFLSGRMSSRASRPMGILFISCFLRNSVSLRVKCLPHCGSPILPMKGLRQGNNLQAELRRHLHTLWQLRLRKFVCALVTERTKCSMLPWVLKSIDQLIYEVFSSFPPLAALMHIPRRNFSHAVAQHITPF